MGDPKRQRKKYLTPMHPWSGVRIAEEKILSKEYGLKNKKEIWKTESVLRRFKIQAKNLTATGEDQQADREAKLLISKLNRLNLVSPSAKMEDVLSLSLKDLLNRRLQTLVFNKGLSKSVKQARQFIVHGHVFVGDKKVNVPSYLVLADEEVRISFDPNSSLSDSEHPERIVKKNVVEVKTQLVLDKKDDKEEHVVEQKPKKDGKAVKPVKKKETKKVKNDSSK